VPEAERVAALAALESVDAVTVFEEDTPLELVGALLPDVLVKGGDYDLDGIVGREAVEESGGEVRVLPFLEGYSTTGILDAMQAGE
jgi:D-beta-D-heptose 7-phosphate kinase/D-beta-D-heptose 1-phosphate adenosyltransferase